VAEYRVWHEGSAGIELTKKYEVTVRIYLLNVFYEKKLGVAKVIAVTGRDWKKYLREWVKSEGHRMHFTRVEGNQLFYAYPQPEKNYASVALERDVFFLKPITIKGGFEYWTLAGWNRKKLAEMPKRAKKIGSHAVFKLLSIHREKPELFVSTAAGALSPRQVETFQSAVEQGYYGYPKKTNLKQLANTLGLSQSTAREHLRLAEAKLMPAVSSQLGRG
jgi:predicted DNA binding protein